MLGGALKGICGGRVSGGLGMTITVELVGPFCGEEGTDELWGWDGPGNIFVFEK